MRPLDQLRLVDRASVFKSGILAATLERRREAVVFEYTEAYLASGRVPVATTLPLGREPVVTHAPGALPPFFSGLLPEGRRLSALRGAVKTSADDEMTLLLAVGADAVGDVSVVPEGEAVEETEARVTISEWGDVRFADLLRTPGAGGQGVDRVAIPGVQDKVSARMINVPVSRAGDRFVLKLNPPEFPNLVANEAFFLEAARRSGLDVAEAEEVEDSVGETGLLVRRFDREVRDGAIHSLAQEDGCQVLGRYPADKYRVTTEEVIDGLAGVCRARIVAAQTFLEQFAFAYITCNGDAHAKNFSVRFIHGEWRPTPIYDVPTSYVYNDHTMALSLNGKQREDIGRADFVGLGEEVGVRARATERMLDGIVGSVATWIDGVRELPFDQSVLRKLRRAIEYRCDRLARG